MAVIEIAKIQVRRGQENVTGVPQLDPGEFGWAEDTQHLYIGKRIVEGASSDANTRILTDVDLKNIFDVLGGGTSGSVASTSTYRYRDDLDFLYFRSTTTTVGKKLDLFASLSDFSQTPLSGDITQVLKTAINDIYSNNYYGTATIRTLKIPAGQFTISGIVDLPPMVTLIGEGAGVTTLVLDSVGTGMFRTVDALGAHFEQGMQFDGRASMDVSISDMTLAYSGNYANIYPLIYLDNTERPKIKNVEFTTLNTVTNVITGIGIVVQGSIGTDESTVICRDIEISDCNFSAMRSAIAESGQISNTVIANNVFSNLRTGIFITTGTNSSAMPHNINISKNKFTFMYNEAIGVTTSTIYTGIISSENSYYYAGNRSSSPDQTIGGPARPVLIFNAPGNVSLNDTFNRADVAYGNNFYYNALISGNAKIVDSKTRTFLIGASTQNQLIRKIPLTGRDQLATFEYQLNNAGMSRKGRLTLNISSDSYASVSDYYNFSEIDTNESYNLVFSTDSNTASNFVSLICSSFSAYNTVMEYTVDITV